MAVDSNRRRVMNKRLGRVVISVWWWSFSKFGVGYIASKMLQGVARSLWIDLGRLSFDIWIEPK